jgi:hypothetical protein
MLLLLRQHPSASRSEVAEARPRQRLAARRQHLRDRRRLAVPVPCQRLVEGSGASEAAVAAVLAKRRGPGFKRLSAFSRASVGESGRKKRERRER